MSDSDALQDRSMTFGETEIYFASPAGGQGDTDVRLRQNHTVRQT
jgi:hypothetical protein